MSETRGPTLFIDADACPVKDECYRVAARHGSQVYLVSNRRIGVPRDPQIALIIVDEGLDKADDWIAERAVPRSVVVTADIPLAARCVGSGGQAVTPKGEISTRAASACAGFLRASAMTYLLSAGMKSGQARPRAFFHGAQTASRFCRALKSAMRRASPRPA